MANLNPGDNFIKTKSINYSLAQTGSGTTNHILIPSGCKNPVTVNLVLTSAGTAKAQYSLSPLSDHNSGATVYWQDWTAGAVTATKREDANNITAVRAVVTSGNWVLEVSA